MNKTIGVLGESTGRSARDMAMRAEFGCGCNPVEAYTQQKLEPRTTRDMAMLKTFNHCGKNVTIPQSLGENYCGKNISIPASLSKRENYCGYSANTAGSGFANIMDDPYNNSKNITYLPLR